MSDSTNPTAPRTPEPVDLGTMSVEELRAMVDAGVDWYSANRRTLRLTNRPDKMDATEAFNELCRRAALAAERSRDTELLDWWEQHWNYEHSVDDDEVEPVAVYKRTGSVNDTEWHLVARGKTLREAIAAARIRALGSETK